MYISIGSINPTAMCVCVYVCIQPPIYRHRYMFMYKHIIKNWGYLQIIMIDIADIYRINNKYKKMIKYYKIGIKLNCFYCILDLADHYFNLKKYIKGKKILLKYINKNILKYK